MAIAIPPTAKRNEQLLEVRVKAPVSCSFVTQPETTINFFSRVEKAYEVSSKVIYDLTETTSFSETAAAVLMAFLKDRSLNKGRASVIDWPENPACKAKLQSFGIQRKIAQSIDDSECYTDTPTQKISSTIVANQVAKNIVDQSSNFLYGTEKRIKELYAILIEMMANTNNHAAAKPIDSLTIDNRQWWLFIFPDSLSKSVKFVFLDLGVGIFDSIPVKQFIQRTPQSLLDKKHLSQNYRRRIQLQEILTNLTSGKIKSSTGRDDRGRGIPLIAEHSVCNHFCSFHIISNDAYIDLREGTASAMNEHFGGTLFHFELVEASNE